MELIQAKHHVAHKGSLTDASEDLWPTLRIWSSQVAADSDAAFRSSFILLTTGVAPHGSAASMLRAQDRDEATARTLLLATASKSKSFKNKPGYDTFRALPELSQRNLLKARGREDVIVADGEANLADLRAERQSLRSDMERLNAEIRSTRLFSAESSGYEHEAKEQRARLSAVGLFKAQTAHDPSQCPICSSVLNVKVPAVEEILSSLQVLNADLQEVEAENPRLQLRLASLQREEATIEEKLRENQQRISARIRENEIFKVQQDAFILRARVIGKVIQYTETASDITSDSALRSQVETLAARVAALEAELDMNTVRERLAAFLNIIGHHMTEYSDRLDLEHSSSQLRLDIRNLTVVADTEDGPVPLYKMGSGENWVGYHILAHLALHKWFRKKGRPVPAFLILDQPSQAHYPPSEDVEGSLDVLEDDDRKAVRDLFGLIDRAAKELAPSLQIIVMDHADLKEEWFQDAVTERWRGGKKLIPTEWLTT